MHLISPLLVALASVSALVFAIPSSPSTSTVVTRGPLDIRIAATAAAYAIHDNSSYGNATDPHNITGYINAYDIHKVHIGRYPASEFFKAATPPPSANCGELTIPQLQLLPGYNTLLAKMKLDHPYKDLAYGRYWSKNEACVASVCSADEAEDHATIKNGTARVSLSYTTGISSETTLTTTKSSTLSIAHTITVGIEIKVFSASASTTFEQSVTNEVTTKTLSSSTTRTIELDGGPFQLCIVKWNVQSCTSVGFARIPFYATGWIAMKPCPEWGIVCPSPIGDLSYYNIDATIPLIDQRSSIMELEGTTRSTSNSNSESGCCPLTGGASQTTICLSSRSNEILVKCVGKCVRAEFKLVPQAQSLEWPFIRPHPPSGNPSPVQSSRHFMRIVQVSDREQIHPRDRRTQFKFPQGTRQIENAVIPLKNLPFDAVTAMFQRAVVANSRALTVLWKFAKNGQRNGHGPRATGAAKLTHCMADPSQTLHSPKYRQHPQSGLPFVSPAIFNSIQWEPAPPILLLTTPSCIGGRVITNHRKSAPIGLSRPCFHGKLA
ncbi:hypothetical protein B0H19DRAFT_1071712 [Mycena capillaripes]|nr:hypothetical protein B0H19DRAFT_1071712 [Mycena capillaripes]